MTEITEEDDAQVDIWPYAALLVKQGLIPTYVYKETLVESAYRNESETYDHVVIPGMKEGMFVVLVVDLIEEEVYGHYPLHISAEYVEV